LLEGPVGHFACRPCASLKTDVQTAAERLCRRSDILHREGWSVLSLKYASGYIDVLHAQQLNQTIIVRFRGSDHE
jgi:hypothetical protein